VAGWNTYENSANTHDGNGHGTFVAGVAGALGNNGVGVTGVSWNVPVMPMKCLSDGGEGSESTIAAAIVWAADHGADVANISLSTYSGTDTLHAAVLYAHDQGVVLVASVGANQSQGIGYPARYPECVAVGATGPHDDWASFSVYGPQIDVVAPGVDIYSTYLNSGYTWMSGVSFSTAYTSGLAALIRSYNPGLTNAQVEQILAESADDLGPPGWDDHFGWGRINAFHALQLASARGDLNCDGAVNFGDINPFVLYLSDFSAWQAAHPGCPAANGDINGDGVYGQGSLGDINPFVALLTGA
jgi:subtilisin family serine protease